MKNFVISIEKKLTDELADKYFIASSGINREGKKYEKIRSAAYSIRNEIEDSRVKINAILSTFSCIKLKDNVLSIVDQTFHCPYFSVIKENEILKCYVYIITAGDFSLDKRPIMDQLLADIWGNSYLDAGREKLEEEIILHFKEFFNESKVNFKLSNSFGPGLFGMPTEEIHNIFKLVDARKIGVNYHKSGVMVPIKSCAGVYFIQSIDALFKTIGCETCVGNSLNCKLCNYIRKDS